MMIVEIPVDPHPFDSGSTLQEFEHDPHMIIPTGYKQVAIVVQRSDTIVFGSSLMKSRRFNIMVLHPPKDIPVFRIDTDDVFRQNPNDDFSPANLDKDRRNKSRWCLEAFGLPNRFPGGFIKGYHGGEVAPRSVDHFVIDN